MLFRQMFDSGSGTYTYLLASRSGAEALIIDPGLEKVDRYIQRLRELDFRLVTLIPTFTPITSPVSPNCAIGHIA
jgi:sulfur dioxygenase